MTNQKWPRGAGDAATAEIRDLLDVIPYLPLSQRERDLYRMELRAGGGRARFAQSLLSSFAPVRVGPFADAMSCAHRRNDALAARLRMGAA